LAKAGEYTNCFRREVDRSPHKRVAIPSPRARLRRGRLRGHSGNPGGRVSGISRELVLFAQSHAPDAIKTLAEISNDRSAPDHARIYAANSLLDRGLGKVKEMSKHELDEPLTIVYVDAIDAGL
jgi:hypothetical protein